MHRGRGHQTFKVQFAREQSSTAIFTRRELTEPQILASGEAGRAECNYVKAYPMSCLVVSRKIFQPLKIIYHQRPLWAQSSGLKLISIPEARPHQIPFPFLLESLTVNSKIFQFINLTNEGETIQHLCFVSIF